MLKIYAMQATKNVAVAFNGNLRENFKEGDKIITTRDEYRNLLRLGFELIEEKDIWFDDIFISKEKETEKSSKKENSNDPETQEKDPENPEPPKDGE